MAINSDTRYADFAHMKPSARFTLPPASLFKFPPSEIPRTLPPPPDHPTLAHPFSIPTGLYNAALSPVVPTTIALVYITTVTYLNSVNKSRNYKPWAFSKTRIFKLLVITHNIFLSLYSAWTFIGMLNALRVSLYPPWHELGLAGTVDSLCKVNGPRGLGSAATYNETTSAWGIANRFFHLGADGLTPEVTDVGRLWNEGLAFYGWLFYLSKFYEVLDTLIIIAKGKKSSFLQTYHHAGAMLCMWAGVRYMSGPIWIFVLANSFIHTIMYTFYFFTAIRVKVPVWLKRTLTTMQIAQFVIGASFAFIHMFIEYQSPISVPYLYQLGDTATAVASDVSSAASAVATATASADLAAYVKKALLRAAGREGLAENVFNNQGRTFGIDAQHPARGMVKREETRYREEFQYTHCLDTSGQTFAVYLNVLYLAPLTWLFVRFFIKSYLQRLERRRSSTAGEKARLAIQSSRDASRGVGRRVSEALEDSQGGINGTDDDVAIIDEDEVKSAFNDFTQGARAAKMEVDKAVSGTKKGMSHAFENLTGQADLVKAKAQNQFQVDLDKAKETYQNVKTGIASSAEHVKEAASTSIGVNGGEKRPDAGPSTSVIRNVTDNLQEKAGSTIETVKNVTGNLQEQTAPAIESVKNVTGNLQEQTAPAIESVKNATESLQEKTAPAIESVKNAISDVPGTNVKPEDTNGSDQSSKDESAGHDTQSATDESSQEQHDVPEARKEDDVFAADGADATDEKADHQSEVAESKDKDKEVTEDAEDDNHGQVPGSDQEVRQEDLDEKSRAEPSTGDTEAAKSPTEQRTPQDHAAEDLNGENGNRKDVHSTEDSNKEEPSVEDSGEQDVPAQDVSRQEEPIKESANNSPQDQGASWVHVGHEDDERDITAEKSNQGEEAAPVHKAEGREDSGDLATANDTPEKAAEDTEKTDTNKPAEGEQGDKSAQDVTKSEAESVEDHPKEQAASDAKDTESSSKPMSYADAVTENTKNDTEQKEDDSHTQELTEGEKPSQTDFEGGKQDKMTDEPNEDASKGENKQTQSSPTKTTSGDKADSAPSSTSPQWFEKLTSGIDSEEAGATEGNGQDKDSDEIEKEKKEQDEIIAESEPVRDEIKDTVNGQNEATNTKTKQDADVAESEKKEQDKIIAESEPVRDEVKNTDSKHGQAKDTETKQDVDTDEVEKEEQDQIIAESEPVRDEVKDTEAEQGKEGGAATPSKKNKKNKKAAKSQAGA